MPLSSIARSPVTTKNDPVLDEEVRKRIGGRLKALRIQAHLDQLEVARRAKISPGTLQTIEWGARENRTVNIAKVAKVLGTSLEALTRKEHIAPNDPLLRELNREDWEIARAYHEASSMVRQHARQLLRERDPQVPTAPTSAEAAARAARIARLTSARQQLVDELIHQLDTLDQRDEDIG
jgi:transcriptional regulator with XRE-family HTH domain